MHINMYAIVGLFERTREGKRVKENYRVNMEIQQICVGTENC
jgi:hypothetical protein